MSNEIAAIDIQMNEFAMSIQQLDNTCNILYSMADEIINDYKNGTQSLAEAISCVKESNTSFNEDGVKKFEQDLLNNYNFELKKVENIFKHINSIMKESKEFETLESATRRELISNIEGFEESNLKKLINLKPQDVNPLDNPKYVKLQELINKIAETDDLVIDPVQNQVIKCPITSLPIQNPFKHKCGHSYEMDAILNYCKARNVLKRCPYAGCSANISYNDVHPTK